MRAGPLVAAAMLLLSLALASSPVASAVGSSELDGTTASQSPAQIYFGNDATENITAYLFYGNGCPHCALIEPYVDTMIEKYPQVTFLKLEVYYNGTNRDLYQAFNTRFSVQDPVVPSIFLGSEAMVGEGSIETRLEPAIRSMLEAEAVPDGGNCTDGNCDRGANDTNGTVPAPDVPPEDGTGDGSMDLTIAMVIVAAASDSINPCAISVMIILLIFLTGLGDR